VLGLWVYSSELEPFFVMIFFYRSGNSEFRLRTRFQIREAKFLFGELHKHLLQLKAVCHYPLTLVVRNNSIRLVLMPLPTDAIITIETSSALDEVSMHLLGYARPVVAAVSDSSETIEDLTPGSRSESPETLLDGSTADKDGLEPVPDAANDDGLETVDDAAADAGPSSAQLGEEEDSTKPEAETSVEDSSVDTGSLQPIASETEADEATDLVPVTAGDPGRVAVGGQGSSPLCGSFSPMETEVAMTLSCLAAGSPRDHVPATAATGGDLPVVSPTGLLDVPSPVTSLMEELQSNHDMSKNAMFSLSPFDYSPSNFLIMSPVAGPSNIQIITHDDDDDDEPEIIFSNIPEKKKSLPIPAEEFQVEILQRIGKLEDLIKKCVDKG
jgi:hypothetical protein